MLLNEVKDLKKSIRQLSLTYLRSPDASAKEEKLYAYCILI